MRAAENSCSGVGSRSSTQQTVHQAAQLVQWRGPEIHREKKIRTLLWSHLIQSRHGRGNEYQILAVFSGSILCTPRFQGHRALDLENAAISYLSR